MWRCPLGWHDGWTISGASHCHTLEDKRPPCPCRECSPNRFCLHAGREGDRRTHCDQCVLWSLQFGLTKRFLLFGGKIHFSWVHSRSGHCQIHLGKQFSSENGSVNSAARQYTALLQNSLLGIWCDHCHRHTFPVWRIPHCHTIDPRITWHPSPSPSPSPSPPTSLSKSSLSCSTWYQDGDVSVSYQFSAGEGIKIQFSDQEWFSCLAFSAKMGIKGNTRDTKDQKGTQRVFSSWRRDFTTLQIKPGLVAPVLERLSRYTAVKIDNHRTTL